MLTERVFIGRDDELGRLEDALDDSFAGRARLAMLVGDAGIGKTTTAEQFRRRAQGRGAVLLAGRCHEDEGAPPYWPWIQVIRGAIEGAASGDLDTLLGGGTEDLAQIVPDLRARLAQPPAAAPADPEAARFRLFDSITSFLKRASKAAPIVVLLDDLHWADKPSLLLLRFLVREMGSARLLLLGTYREFEVPRTHPLAEVLPDLHRGEACQRIVLGGLGEGETRSLLRAIAPQAASERFTRRIFEESEGNPFFIQELVRHLLEERALDADPLAEPDAAVARARLLPESVRELLERRLARLGPACRRTLALASVIGREFDLRSLGALTGAEVTDPKAALREAIAAHIVTPLAGDSLRYGFSHALMREALYEGLIEAERLRLHRDIGAMFERRLQERPDLPLSLPAHHFFEAARYGGAAGPAIDYATRAGEQALAALAYEEAARQFARARTVLESGTAEDPARHARLLLKLGDAQRKSGDIAQARETFHSAWHLARRMDLRDEMAQAALGYGGLLIAPGIVDATLIDLIERTLARFGAEDHPLVARLLARQAMEFYYSPQRDRRLELSARAVRMAERLDDPQTLAASLSARRYAIWSPENLTERLETTTEMLRRAYASGDREAALLGHHWRVVDRLEAGDLAGAKTEMAEHASIAAELRQPFHVWYAAIFGSMRVLLAGRLDDCEAEAQKALALGQRVQPPVALHLRSVQNFQLRWLQGRLDESRDSTAAFAAQFPTLPVWRCALAHLCTETDDEPGARAEFERLATDDFKGLPRDGNWLIAMFHLAEVCAWLEDRARAERLYAQIAPFAGHVIVSGRAVACWGAVDHALGVLATVTGRWDAADAHLDRALTLNLALDSPPLVAHTQLRYAMLLLARGRVDAGDHGGAASAREFLGAALATAQRLGMRKLAQRAQALLPLAAQAMAVNEEATRPGTDGETTILLSDMEGFSSMTERLGDRAAHQVMQSHQTIVQQNAAAHGGSAVEFQGDGFVVAFRHPLGALRCAVSIQKAFARYSVAHPEQPIRVRMGLHCGDPLLGERLFGKTLIVASRIAALAHGGDIFVSGVVRSRAGVSGDFVFDPGRDVQLKGLAGSYRVHRLLWSDGGSALPEPR